MAAFGVDDFSIDDEGLAETCARSEDGDGPGLVARSALKREEIVFAEQRDAQRYRVEVIDERDPADRERGCQRRALHHPVQIGDLRLPFPHRAGHGEAGGVDRPVHALQKIAQSTDNRLNWHLIGHLQSNKARKAASAAHVIHAIDSVDLLNRIDQAAGEAGRTIDVLIQVDLALEDTKFGAPVTEVAAIASNTRAALAASSILERSPSPPKGASDA